LKNILQIFILVSLFFNLANGVEFKEIIDITLKKDEVKKILVRYDGKEKLLKFRWTLFVNNGLVVLRSYDKIVAQNVLYMRHKNRSFRQELRTKGADFYNTPYVLVRFKEFKHDTNEAVFELLLSDASATISLNYLK